MACDLLGYKKGSIGREKLAWSTKPLTIHRCRLQVHFDSVMEGLFNPGGHMQGRLGEQANRIHHWDLILDEGPPRRAGKRNAHCYQVFWASRYDCLVDHLIHLQPLHRSITTSATFLSIYFSYDEFSVLTTSAMDTSPIGPIMLR